MIFLHAYLLMLALSFISVLAFYRRQEPHDTLNNIACAFVVAAMWPVVLLHPTLVILFRGTKP